MTDLHTHILPGMDDGSRDTDMSLRMLRMEWEQGVRQVVVTPHFYRDQERTDHFLHRRQDAWDQLQEAIHALPPEEQQRLPALRMGAEVAWVPNMAEWESVSKLCYEGTRFLLLELPVTKWSSDLFRQIYELRSFTGLEPVIAHIDRYFDQSPERLSELFSLGLPVQLSAGAFSGFTSRRKALGLLRQVPLLLISDCHNLTSRPPNLGQAMAFLSKKLKGEAEDLFARTDELLPEPVFA